MEATSKSPGLARIPRDAQLALLGGIAGGIAGAVAGGLLGFGLTRLFPSVQQIVVVSDALAASSKGEIVHEIPRHAFHVKYAGHSPGTDGLVGIGRTSPYFWYAIQVFNNSEAPLNGIQITTRTSADVLPYSFTNVTRAGPIARTPDGAAVDFIENKTQARKLTACIKNLGPGQLHKVMLGVKAKAMPAESDLGLVVQGEHGQFVPVPAAAWNDYVEAGRVKLP